MSVEKSFLVSKALRGFDGVVGALDDVEKSAYTRGFTRAMGDHRYGKTRLLQRLQTANERGLRGKARDQLKTGSSSLKYGHYDAPHRAAMNEFNTGRVNTRVAELKGRQRLAGGIAGGSLFGAGVAGIAHDKKHGRH